MANECCGSEVSKFEVTHQEDCSSCEAQILFDDTSNTSISPVISVRGAPVHIIVSAAMPEDHVITVERSIVSGACPDIPWSPFPCDTCCGSNAEPTSLFNVVNPSNANDRKIQNEIWLTEAGDYRLIYEEGFAAPLSTTVYAITDCMEGGVMKSNCCPPTLEPCPPSESVRQLNTAPSPEEFIYCQDGVRKQKPLSVLSTNTNTTVESTDGTVIVTPSTNPEGAPHYNLSVPCQDPQFCGVVFEPQDTKLDITFGSNPLDTYINGPIASGTFTNTQDCPVRMVCVLGLNLELGCVNSLINSARVRGLVDFGGGTMDIWISDPEATVSHDDNIVAPGERRAQWLNISGTFCGLVVQPGETITLRGQAAILLKSPYNPGTVPHNVSAVMSFYYFTIPA